MEDLTRQLRRERATSALLPLFFCSGIAGLVYQVLWAKQLQLVFGTSTFAISTVLSTFMLGLAVGGLVAARVADGARWPLAVYGYLEIGIGLYALVFPLILRLVEPLYLQVGWMFHPGPVVFGVVQFVLVGATLLVPTAAMGATLPLIARFATDRMATAGSRIGTLYAVNTAGAVAGTWLAGFLLLPGIGLTWTTWLTAAVNFALGLAAILLSRWAHGTGEVPASPDLDAPRSMPWALPLVAGVMGLAGAASLIYEVAWTRLLALLLGASAYAFALMLLAFLVGIAVGGQVGGKLGDVLLRRGGQAAVLRALVVAQVLVGLLSFLLMTGFDELPFWYVWLYDGLGGSDSIVSVWALSLILAGLVMTPPALIMGASFPLAVRAVVGSTSGLARPVGIVYGVNTAGSVVGAALAGFVLLPTIQLEGTIVTAVFVNLLGACTLLAALLWRRPRILLDAPVSLAVVAVAVVVPLVTFWPMTDDELAEYRLMKTAGMYKYVTSFSSHTREGILDFTVRRYKLLFYEEGLSSVVTVAENREDERHNRWLANNGKIDASTTDDMPTQVLVALLPFAFVEASTEAMVIGLASGITAGSVVEVPDLERVDVVELEPAIVRAATFFEDYNHHVLDNPRMNLIFNDGRNQVLLSEPASYDVIVSEPSNPWISGVANLFTREFLELGKSRLRPGGVWSQWVQLYGMDEDDLRSLLRTFCDVYPHVALFMTIAEGDLVVLGSDAPLVIDAATMSRFVDRWPAVTDELARVDMDEPFSLLSRFWMDRSTMLELAGDIGLNTDDNMRIEYSAPLNLYNYTSAPNMRLLDAHAQLPPAVQDPLQLGYLAERYLEYYDETRSMRAMSEMLRSLGVDDPAVIEPLARADALVASNNEYKALGDLELAARAALGDDPRHTRLWDRWFERIVDRLLWLADLRRRIDAGEDVEQWEEPPPPPRHRVELGDGIWAEEPD